MGLFINENQHPRVFKNNGELISANQVEFQSDYLSELVKEQQLSNQSVQQAIYSLENTQTEFSEQQLTQWKEIDKRLSELKELHSQHQILEHEVLDIRQSHGEIVNRLDQFGVGNNEVVNRLEQVKSANEKMMSKIDEQHTLHQTMAKQVSTINKSQKELVNRVDAQEGLMEKIIHQIDNVRFNLFERTNFLEEKIEKLYKSSIEYIQKVKK